jgi:PPOX class probable F420-dependent enzyme
MLDGNLKTLATGKNFAAVTTLFANGQPQSSVLWVDADDEHLLLNTEVHRQKYKNIERDPRVTVMIIDAANPYHYAEVRGRVVEVVTGKPARDHIDQLSLKYNGRPYDPDAIQSERVILRIAPERQRVHGE